MATKKPRSFRLHPSLLARLDRRAAEQESTATELVERYIDEGMRRDTHPLIAFRDGAAGRRPALVGTRLDVWHVVETVKTSGRSIAAAAEYLSISEAAVRACVRYYAEHKGEVDAWARRMRAESRRAEEAWRREQEVLA